jgi:hypothetical protein
MELLETNSPKSELIKKSMEHKKALEEDVKDFSDRTGKIITNAVIVGGALALTYLVVRSFMSSGSSSKPKKRKFAAVSEPIEEERSESKISAALASVGTVLASQATAFLLGMAREKLMDYLASQQEKKNEIK